MKTSLIHPSRSRLSLRARALKPRKLSPDSPVMLYLHGGAYCRPITSHHWRFLQWLVTAHECVVVVPAPESQCVATVQALRNMHALMSERHGQFDAFVGDSAGAGLCVAFCLALRASNEALPNRLVLISPFVDALLTHPLVGDTARRDPMLGILGIREAGLLYAGDLCLDHPFVTPLQADLHDLPAMQIFVGTMTSCITMPWPSPTKRRTLAVM